MSNRKLHAIILTISVLLSLLVVSSAIIPPPESEEKSLKFLIADWDYPDAYGQGIEALIIYENSTGSWAIHEDGIIFYDASQADSTLDWDAGVGMRLMCATTLNSTLVGVGSRVEGRLYLRHYVSVLDNTDSVVFSQQNFTYDYSHQDNDPIYYYEYLVVLDFLPLVNQVYTITVMYEIYY